MIHHQGSGSISRGQRDCTQDRLTHAFQSTPIACQSIMRDKPCRQTRILTSHLLVGRSGLRRSPTMHTSWALQQQSREPPLSHAVEAIPARCIGAITTCALRSAFHELSVLVPVLQPTAHTRIAAVKTLQQTSTSTSKIEIEHINTCNQPNESERTACAFELLRST